MILTQELTRRFGSITALSDLNLNIPQGSAFALLGPNGAGKTTAIRIMLNILRASGGTAEVLGCNSRKLGPRELARIGYVSENRDLPGWMRVSSFFDYCRKFYPEWSEKEAAALARMFELPLDITLDSLSRGMRMKAALACALACRPELLILDEPFSGLDVLVRERLIESIAERTPDCTVLIATHDLSDIESFATHVAYLSEGRLMFAEEMDTLTARFREIEVLIENPMLTTELLPDKLPESWWNTKQAAGVVRFTHADYNSERCDSEVRKHWTGVRDVNVRALPLRSIFIALAGQRVPGR